MPTDPSTDQPNPLADAPASQPVRGQRPWHQPKLTRVALQVTGLGSGTTEDQAGSSVTPK